MQEAGVAKYQFKQFAATRLYTNVLAYSPDGKQIAHVNNGSGQLNLWTIPSGGGFPRQLTAFMDNAVRAIVWSPDSRYLTVVDVHSNTDVDIIVLGTKTGEPINATPHEGEIIFAPGPWARDNSGFYIVTNQGREYIGLAFYTLASRSWAWVE